MDASKLAALLAARICHDISSPVSSLVIGVGLLDDGGDMRVQAEDLLKSGVGATSSKLEFLRYAFGSLSAPSGSADMHKARELTEAFFKDLKPNLVWNASDEPLNFAEMRLLMNLAIIVGESLAWGGDVVLSAQRDGHTRVLAARGAAHRVDLKAAARAAVEGREPEEGWAGKTVQPYFAKLIAADMGGEITLSAGEGRVEALARTPI